MPKEFGYYHVDCGHFPAQIKLCFSDDMFQRVLRDHGIREKATALDEGIAETHYLTDGKQGIIILAFDLDECIDEDPAYLAGVIAHEATHCVCRVFEHIGEEPDEIGEESRAYLTEHIVKQITTGISMELDKRARKASRKPSRQKGKAGGGIEPKVDIVNNRRPGPNSVSQPAGAFGGVKNKKWGAVKKTTVNVSAICRVGFSGDRIAIKGRG